MPCVHFAFETSVSLREFFDGKERAAVFAPPASRRVIGNSCHAAVPLYRYVNTDIQAEMYFVYDLKSINLLWCVVAHTPVNGYIRGGDKYDNLYPCRHGCQTTSTKDIRFHIWCHSHARDVQQTCCTLSAKEHNYFSFRHRATEPRTADDQPPAGAVAGK